MSAQDEVSKASNGFYAALNSMLEGDATPLTKIWSHSTDVTTMHPVGGREVGWQRVKETWEQVAKATSGGRVTLRDQLVRIVGDLAYEVGTEQGHAVIGGKQVSFDHRVTNIYRRESDGWRIVHHHTDVSAAMVEALEALQAKT